MTAPSTKGSGVGFRLAQVFELDANGYPAATATTAYEGIQLSGARTLTLNVPNARQISHYGDDRIFAVDVLPPNEAVTGELQGGRYNDDLDAILSGINVVTAGEAKLIGRATSQQGSEPQVGMLAYRQALDETGARVWRFKILPKVLIYPTPETFDENPQAKSYQLFAQVVTKHLWGTAFAAGTEGYTEAQFLEGVCKYKPKLVAFLADGVEDEFLFPAAAQAVSTDKIAVWNNGTLVSAGLTKAVDKLTFSSPPASGAMIVVLYEVA